MNALAKIRIKLALLLVSISCATLCAQQVHRVDRTNQESIILPGPQLGHLPVYILVRADSANHEAQTLLSILQVTEELHLIDTLMEVFVVRIINQKSDVCAATELKLNGKRLSAAKYIPHFYILADTFGIQTIDPERRRLVKGHGFYREYDFEGRLSSFVYIDRYIDLFKYILKPSHVDDLLLPHDNIRFSIQMGANCSFVHLIKSFSPDIITHPAADNRYHGHMMPKVTLSCSFRLAAHLWLTPSFSRNKVGYERRVTNGFTYPGTPNWTILRFTETITTTEIGLPFMYEFGPIGRGKASIHKQNLFTNAKSRWFLFPSISMGPVFNFSTRFAAQEQQDMNIYPVQTSAYRRVPWIGITGGAGLSLVHGFSNFSLQVTYRPSTSNWVYYADRQTREETGFSRHIPLDDEDWSISSLMLSLGYGFWIDTKQHNKK